MREPIPMNVTYHREHGLHTVKQEHGEDYIASYREWEDLIGDLKSGLPKKGNVITPEYITVPSDIKKMGKVDPNFIQDRISQARSLTRKSDITLHLGTPTPFLSQNGGRKWHNSVLSIHRGEVVNKAHKTTLVPSERTMGIERPEYDQRMIKMGNAVLICAELFLYFIDKNNRLSGQNVRQIFAPTMWANPSFEGGNLRDIENAGGEDPHYRNQLEYAIGTSLFNSAPTVNRVIVSDRGRPDLPPYNAVFDRDKSTS